MRNSHARLTAALLGERHFLAVCPSHGIQPHYTSSGRCMVCAAKAKDPAKQAAYWAAKRDQINADRRAKRSNHAAA